VNWIDTAPSYGNGKSEESLGWLLKEISPQPYLSTKFRIDPAAGDIPGQIEKSTHESLRRLQRSSVDLLQLHNPVMVERNAHRGLPSTPSLSLADVLGQNGVVEGLRRMEDQRLTRFTGFTGLGETSALHQMVDSGGFDSAQVYYNVLNPSAGRSVPRDSSAYDFRGLISRCAMRGMAVMNIRVLAAGVVATQQRRQQEVAMFPGSDSESDARRASMVREALGDSQGTMAQAAIRFALANPGISGVLVGFSTLAHIDEALGAVARGPMDPAAIARLALLWESDFGRFSLPA
jgi:aryl-alcohol dehydrogenase-like predicted oxidoreductase